MSAGTLRLLLSIDLPVEPDRKGDGRKYSRLVRSLREAAGAYDAPTIRVKACANPACPHGGTFERRDHENRADFAARRFCSRHCSRVSGDRFVTAAQVVLGERRHRCARHPTCTNLVEPIEGEEWRKVDARKYCSPACRAIAAREQQAILQPPRSGSRRRHKKPLPGTATSPSS